MHRPPLASITRCEAGLSGSVVISTRFRPTSRATGNITATVLGRHYLGAGASIANTMVFGYRAARHAAATRPDTSDTSAHDRTGR